MQQGHHLPSKKPYRELIQIAVPIILGQVGVILINFVDNMMIGHYDTHHLAAASFANNLWALVYVLGGGLAYGLTPLVTTAWTRGNELKAGVLLRLSLVGNLLFALGASLVMLGIYCYLDRFDLDPALLPIVRPYFLLHFLGFLFYMLFNAFKQFFDGAGYTKVGMWIVLGAIGTNILGNWLLIYGHGGFPELGLFGAGIATVFARLIALGLIVAVLMRSPRFARASRGFFSRYWSRRNMLRLVKLGVPVATYSGVESAAFTIALLMVTTLGTIPLAVHQILCVITNLGFMMYYGLGAATSILVNRYHSRGDSAGVLSATRVGLEISIAIALVAMAVMSITRGFIARIFNEDPDIIVLTSLALIPVILYQLGDAIQILYANVLRGVEDVKLMAIYASCIHLVVTPSMAYLFGFHLGLDDPFDQFVAIWSAFPIGLLLVGLLFRHRFHSVVRP